MTPGDVVQGRFEIDAAVGAGAMGDVYRARDRATGDVVAVKVLRHSQHAERFEREARLLATLADPAIVGYVAHGDTEDGRRYLAMEWLEGETLAERLATRPLRVTESSRIVGQIARALSVAHAAGVIHRDVKPSNVFLTTQDRVKLLDFGVARARDRHRTASGVVIGTLSYMAPEQARGQKDVDARADLFGLGCVLYECLTGRPPFWGKTALDVRIAVISTEPPRLRGLRPELPHDFDLLVHMLLSKDPKDRFLDARAIAKSLRSLERIDADPPGPSLGVGETEQTAFTAADSLRIA